MFDRPGCDERVKSLPDHPRVSATVTVVLPAGYSVRLHEAVLAGGS